MSSKRPQTFAKRDREQATRDKRQAKQEKKQAAAAAKKAGLEGGELPAVADGDELPETPAED